MKLMASNMYVFVSVIQGHQLSSADLRLLNSSWKQSRESK